MQPKVDPNLMDFDQAIALAIDLVPGLRHDMNQIADMRKGGPKDMQGIGRMALRIPDPVLPIVRAYHPELYEGTKEETARAWRRFMRHPHSERFRVHPKGANA